mmetsp:Transcript_22179/g.68126  ORF Transcript_22179/g.68126 Transcript_22179/m.68126 type:complete len:259 (+) Transcript_22179:3362-4138(+)
MPTRGQRSSPSSASGRRFISRASSALRSASAWLFWPASPAPDAPDNMLRRRMAAVARRRRAAPSARAGSRVSPGLSLRGFSVRERSSKKSSPSSMEPGDAMSSEAGPGPSKLSARVTVCARKSNGAALDESRPVGLVGWAAPGLPLGAPPPPEPGFACGIATSVEKSLPPMVSQKNSTSVSTQAMCCDGAARCENLTWSPPSEKRLKNSTVASRMTEAKARHSTCTYAEKSPPTSTTLSTRRLSFLRLLRKVRAAASP